MAELAFKGTAETGRIFETEVFGDGLFTLAKSLNWINPKFHPLRGQV